MTMSTSASSVADQSNAEATNVTASMASTSLRIIQQSSSSSLSSGSLSLTYSTSSSSVSLKDGEVEGEELIKTSKNPFVLLKRADGEWIVRPTLAANHKTDQPAAPVVHIQDDENEPSTIDLKMPLASVPETAEPVMEIHSPQPEISQHYALPPPFKTDLPSADRNESSHVGLDQLPHEQQRKLRYLLGEDDDEESFSPPSYSHSINAGGGREILVLEEEEDSCPALQTQETSIDGASRTANGQETPVIESPCSLVAEVTGSVVAVAEEPSKGSRAIARSPLRRRVSQGLGVGGFPNATPKGGVGLPPSGNIHNRRRQLVRSLSQRSSSSSSSPPPPLSCHRESLSEGSVPTGQELSREYEVIWHRGKLGLSLRMSDAFGVEFVCVDKVSTISSSNGSKEPKVCEEVVQKVKVGDALMEINGMSLFGLTLDQVVDHMIAVSKPVHLVFLRSPENNAAAFANNPPKKEEEATKHVMSTLTDDQHPKASTEPALASQLIFDQNNSIVTSSIVRTLEHAIETTESTEKRVEVLMQEKVIDKGEAYRAGRAWEPPALANSSSFGASSEGDNCSFTSLSSPAIEEYLGEYSTVRGGFFVQNYASVGGKGNEWVSESAVPSNSSLFGASAASSMSSSARKYVVRWHEGDLGVKLAPTVMNGRDLIVVEEIYYDIFLLHPGDPHYCKVGDALVGIGSHSLRGTNFNEAIRRLAAHRKPVKLTFADPKQYKKKGKQEESGEESPGEQKTEMSFICCSKKPFNAF